MKAEEQPEEWEMPPQAETHSIAPEEHPRLQGLLTELVLSAAGVVIFQASASTIPDLKPLRSLPPPPLAPWEQVLYEWVPGALSLLAIGCLVWLLTIPLRMSALKRS